MAEGATAPPAEENEAKGPKEEQAAIKSNVQTWIQTVIEMEDDCHGKTDDSEDGDGEQLLTVSKMIDISMTVCSSPE